MIYTRNEAAEIVELFEDLLEKHGMSVPDSDREGREEEGALYGMTYWNLLYEVEERLSVLVDRATREAVITQEFGS